MVRQRKTEVAPATKKRETSEERKAREDREEEELENELHDLHNVPLEVILLR